MTDQNKKEESQTIEVRPNEYETVSDALIERCDGDMEIAGFFHCLGKALSKDCKVDSKYLKANLDGM